MPHDVFLSYSSKDKPTADAVCALLEREGLRCWIAPRDIKPGEDWPEAIITALDGCEVLVLVFSSHSNESNQCKREVERAFDKGLPVLPLRIEHVEPSKSLEYFISTPHWLDAVNPPLEDHTKKLAFTIRTIIKSPPPMPRKRKRPPIMPLIARPVREDGSKAPWVLSV
ncbi:MAG TPA: toll/interleukin-1 receptor domain-containing protein, partial [Tepidisphaeraceae bacterium]|nr:toll/interleukin-1 receptor domain-containing protein [Tepidisphaeraceae bacterium]